MSTEEALLEYDTCAEKVFSSRNKKWYVKFAPFTVSQPSRRSHPVPTADLVMGFFRNRSTTEDS